MNIAETVLNYIKVLLGWPVIVFILGLIFFKLFKDPICDFFKRLVKAEAYGVRVEASNQLEKLKEAKETLPIKTEDELKAYIRDNPDKVIELNIRLLNAFHFERTFNIIYGTQVDLLGHLSNKGDAGEKYINLAVYYNEFLKRIGSTSYQMADYIGFLKSSGYIQFVGEGSELNVKITPHGADFLPYIKTQYASMLKYKPF